MPVADQRERDRALDPDRSFIVQAPAGSGKTGLLIQRFLVLLARVERPESVVAITFTKKAANEMRRRVLDALANAAGPEPDNEHDRNTWLLAKQVCRRDEERGWKLLENPHRLEVRTIDSLCASLVRRMPWLSRLGMPPEIVDDASELYAEAARQTLTLVEDGQYSEPVGRLLLHADNDFSALEARLAALLARRDQWLRHVGIGAGRAEQREALEGALREALVDAIRDAYQRVPPEIEGGLPRLAAFAASNLDGGPIAACAGMRELPGASLEELDAWKGLAELLLTKSGSPRAGVDKRTGFPPAARHEKDAIRELLASVRERPEFCAALHALRSLPPPRYDEQQWAVVDALLTVLPIAVAQLSIVFQTRGQIDYAEVMLAALRALGEPEQPTDLALALDYRIEHLLVDEFQDTSYSQFELLEKLTAGWTPGDGRTLFLVGDPMQSIYRFREAEVGLFLRAARDGIGSVRLEPLRLRVNFRSQQGIVEWVNQTFPPVFPRENDVAAGAVRFSPSVAQRGALEGEAVRIYPFFAASDREEAARVASIIEEERAAGAGTIAVLVRARTHLPSILRVLRERRIRFQAVEIDCLAELPVIQDLLALTRALLNPADRVAWLAVLRAPWCGLTLSELHELAGDDLRASVWDLIRDGARTARLPEAAAARVRRIRTAFEASFAARARTLRELVEGAWMALGGPACAARPGDLENARTFLDLLDALDEGCDADLDALAGQTAALFAGPDPEADGSLQVMSIHKAKGLEFDVVIIPGLGRRARPDDPSLMLWTELTGPAEGGLLLAPIKPAGAEGDLLYEFVRNFDRGKAGHELARLLYVACTRAKQRLHLLGHTRVKDGEVKAPDTSSLLWRIWDAARPVFEAAPIPGAAEEAEAGPPRQVLRRLSESWVLPEPPPAVALAGNGEGAESKEPRDAVSFRWVGETLRHVGTVVHGMLHQIAREGLEKWDAQRVEAARGRFEAALRALGVGPEELPDAAEKVALALKRTLADPRGRWILGAHREAQSEFALTGVRDGEVAGIRIDRTFIDDDGTRWIVDFKTSTHEGGDAEGFLDRERDRYAGQLRLYAELLSKTGQERVRTALYFPLLAGWREG